LEAAAGENDGVRGQCVPRATAFDNQAADAVTFADDFDGLAIVPEAHACAFGGARQHVDEPGAAADRLDARRALGEIVGGLNEFDAERRQPAPGGRSLCGEPREIGFVALRARRLHHVGDEARLDAVGRGHAHVGGRPARIAAGFIRRGLVDHGDVDGRGNGTRGLRGRQRGGEPGGALADDDDVPGCRTGHDVPAACAALRPARRPETKAQAR
jgi:hypothetical protein